MEMKIEYRKPKGETAGQRSGSFPILALRSSLLALGVLWRFLREVSGDAAYESYLAAHADGSPPLSASEFYRQRLERKYSRPCRCC